MLAASFPLYSLFAALTEAVTAFLLILAVVVG